MSPALPRPGLGPLVTQWTWQPVAIAAAVALTGWYAWAVARHRRQGQRWPATRWAFFALGTVGWVWATCGFWEVYVRSMYWVWVAQTLIVWLIVPSLLLSAKPLQLALAVHGEHTWLARVLRSRVIRVLGNPLLTPALVPLLCAFLFFGPLPRWAAFDPAVGWPLRVVLVLVGALITLPLLGIEDYHNTLAAALTLFLGCVELVLGAIPGVVMHLHSSLVSSYFDQRELHPWSHTDLADQGTASTLLWAVGELIVIPFLLILFRQWLRTDARDAAELDAVLDAEYAARAGLREQAGTGDADVPWWISDPQWQEHMHDHHQPR